MTPFEFRPDLRARKLESGATMQSCLPECPILRLTILTQNWRNGQTDRQTETPGQHIPREYVTATFDITQIISVIWQTLNYLLLCLFFYGKFSVCICKPWLAVISRPKPSVVLSHDLSRLASHKDRKPAVSDSKPWLGGLGGKEGRCEWMG